MALDTGSEINSRNDNTVKGFIGFVDYAKSDFVWPETTARNWTDKNGELRLSLLVKEFKSNTREWNAKAVRKQRNKATVFSKEIHGSRLSLRHFYLILEDTGTVNEDKLLTGKVIVIEIKCN